MGGRTGHDATRDMGYRRGDTAVDDRIAAGYDAKWVGATSGGLTCRTYRTTTKPTWTDG